jgi:hypothetical protein
MLEFKQYLKEIRKDYSPEEISVFKNQLDEHNKRLSILENEKNNILKEKQKIESIFNKEN